MTGFFLLILSVILVVCSSYFITCFLPSKKGENSFLFLILIFISQVILSFEFLSFLKLINVPAFLILNFFVFIISLFLWKKYNRKFLETSWIKIGYKNIQKAIFKDKILFFLTVFFIFASVVNLFLAVYAPTNLWDSMIYQVARVPFWIQHGTLAHFETSSVRQVMFPPNSDLFLLWILMFIKKDFLLGLVQYLSYFACLFSIYSFLSYLKLSAGRILWALLIFASLPGIVVQASGTQNHLTPGFLLAASLYLFIYGIFEKEKKSLIFSALALGISIGVKSSVLLFLPAMFLAYLFIAVKARGKDFYKAGFEYLLYFMPAFILLSSYFYVMNYIEFSHPLGLKAFIYEHTFMGKGLESFIANFIRYIFGFIDFTGFDFAKILSFPVLLLRTLLFRLFGLSEGTGLMHGELADDLILVNTRIHDIYSFIGPLGFIIFLPLLFMCINKYIFSRSGKTNLIGLYGVIFVIFIVTISILMGYQLWNNRYLLTAAVISAPVLTFSYIPKNRVNFLKLLIFGTCTFCFIKTPLFNEIRPIAPFKGKSLLTHSREQIRYSLTPVNSIFQDPVKYLNYTAKDGSCIGVIFPETFWYFQFFAQNPTWKLYPFNSELLNSKKLEKLDFLVVYKDKQKVYSLNDPENYYKNVDIDFELISGHFEPEFIIETGFINKKYRSLELGDSTKFYIYRKKSCNELE